MGTGVSPPLWPPDSCASFAPRSHGFGLRPADVFARNKLRFSCVACNPCAVFVCPGTHVALAFASRSVCLDQTSLQLCVVNPLCCVRLPRTHVALAFACRCVCSEQTSLQVVFCYVPLLLL